MPDTDKRLTLNEKEMYDKAMICDGMIHLNRWKIYRELYNSKEKGLYVSEIQKRIGITYTTTDGHIGRMASNGIVSKYKKEDQYYVKLLKEIKLEVEELEG